MYMGSCVYMYYVRCITAAFSFPAATALPFPGLL